MIYRKQRLKALIVEQYKAANQKGKEVLPGTKQTLVNLLFKQQ